MRLTIFAILLAFVFLTNNAVACIDIITSKTYYYPYETVQAEINVNLSRELSASDISVLRQGIVLPTRVFVSKINDNKYAIWFDIPETAGNYSLRARGYCKNGNLYVKNVPFEAKTTTASRYEEIRKTIIDLNRMSVEELILASRVLSYAQAFKDNSNSVFFARRDSCMNAECSAKLNALTLMSFENEIIRQKMIDLTEASQNYINGNWNLQINSNSVQNCNLTINSNISIINLSQGVNNYNLNFDEFKNESAINLIVQCENQSSGRIIYTYKNIVKNFELNNSKISIDNSGCFGNGIKNSCNSEATAYAVLALYETSSNIADAESKAISWLERNAQTIEEKSIVYYITKNNNILSEILSMQNANGWWPQNQNNYVQNVKATSLAVFALKSANQSQTIINSIDKAEKWLLAQRLSLNEKLFVFSFAFQPKEIEPQLAIWPGVIKTEGKFNIILQNKGITDIYADMLLLNSSYNAVIPANDVRNIEFNINGSTSDGRTLFENLIINYHSEISDKNYNYAVPVIIFTQVGQEKLNGTISPGQGTINETQLTNRTADINQDLIRLFRFAEQSVSKNTSINDESIIKIRLSNQLDKEIKNISITYSSSLIGVLTRIEPSYIDKISAGEIKTINLYVKPTSPLTYEGIITASGKYNSNEISTNLNLIINSESEASEAKNCSELNGKICKEDEVCDKNQISASDTLECCVGKCSKKDKGKSIAALIVVGVVIILLIILALLKRKPKKEMEEFLKGATQEYEKKFQRPPSIRR